MHKKQKWIWWLLALLFHSIWLSPQWVLSKPFVFRYPLMIDFWLLLALSAWLSLRSTRFQKTISFCAALFYLLGLLYQLYFQISWALYAEHPNIPNDLLLAQHNLPAFLKQIAAGKAFLYGSLGILATLTFLFLGYLFRWFFRKSVGFNRGEWIIWALLLPVFVLVDGSRSIRSFSIPFSQSIWVSASNRELKIPESHPYQSYPQEVLVSKPDIYLIFVESYGKVLYDNPTLRPIYAESRDKMAAMLQQHGWASSSAFSQAPVSGGRSWLSFSSVISGLDIHNELKYQDLLHSHYYHPHMIRWFHKQGYESYRLKTLARAQSAPFEDQKFVDRYFEYDHWIDYEDVPYSGFVYDWFGGIPDQFALHYFQDQLLKPSDPPRFCFFITINSHTPWFPPPLLKSNWQELNAVQKDPYQLDSSLQNPSYDEWRAGFEKRLNGPGEMRYVKTIQYELEMLSHFICTADLRESIFILIGDHQPGIIWRPDESNWATMVHIISKDSAFVRSFEDFGFQLGLEAPESTANLIHHEGLYSMFVHNFLKHYSQFDPLPAYLPQGLKSAEDQPQIHP